MERGESSGVKRCRDEKTKRRKKKQLARPTQLGLWSSLLPHLRSSAEFALLLLVPLPLPLPRHFSLLTSLLSFISPLPRSIAVGNPLLLPPPSTLLNMVRPCHSTLDSPANSLAITPISTNLSDRNSSLTPTLPISLAQQRLRSTLNY